MMGKEILKTMARQLSEATFQLRWAAVDEQVRENQLVALADGEHDEKKRARLLDRANRAARGWNAKCYVRKVVNRREARAIHLTRAFLGGTPFSTVENVSYTAPDIKRVRTLALQYGIGVRTDSGNEMTEKDVDQQFARWVGGCTFVPTKPKKEARSGEESEAQ